MVKLIGFHPLVFTLLSLFPAICLTATLQVDMVDFAFVPDSLTITEGDTVLWINQGSVIHSTTSGMPCTPDGIWNSGNVSPGDSFSYAFENWGTYPYFCIPHCGGGMTGNVKVNMAPPPGCIGGIVTDTTDTVRLEGVLVQAFQSSAVMGEDTTDSQGVYEVAPLDAGTYDAVASKQGYLPDTTTGISVSSGCTPVNFRLEPVLTECGDCNGDGRITIADATYVVSYIYRGGSAPIGSGDVNLDTRITIADATYLVAFIYRGGYTPCE